MKLISENEVEEAAFEKLAIEFAKYLFSTKVTKHTSMKDSIVYTPPEFNLMKGDLIKRGKELFYQFLKERNDKI